MTKKDEKFYIAIFIIVALLSGWIGLLIDIILPAQAEDETLGMGIWLVLPFLCGILIRAFRRDWHDVGVKPKLKGNGRWYLLAVLVFPVMTVIFTVLAWMFGLANVSSFSVSSMLPIFASLFIALFIKNIFEDFAWQGYLTPKLVSIKMNDFKIYLIVGLVWAFWHAPYYLYFLPDPFYNSFADRMIDAFIISPLIITIWAVMFVEITRITGSVWPAVLMHTIEDAIPTYLLYEEKSIQFSALGDVLFNPLRGILPLIAFLAIGLWLRKKRIERDE